MLNTLVIGNTPAFTQLQVSFLTLFSSFLSLDISIRSLLTRPLCYFVRTLWSRDWGVGTHCPFLRSPFALALSLSPACDRLPSAFPSFHLRLVNMTRIVQLWLMIRGFWRSVLTIPVRDFNHFTTCPLRCVNVSWIYDLLRPPGHIES